MTRQMAMNWSTTRQRITLWLVFGLRPDTMSLRWPMCVEEPKTKGTVRGEPPFSEVDLGQTEADLEKTGKEQMSHMEGGDATKR
jgi:hypothetical protein